MTDRTKGSTAAIAATDLGKVVVIENIVDYRENPSTNGEACNVINVPAGTLVLTAGAEVLRAEGGTAAGTLGDGDGATGFLATLDANATGLKHRGLTLTEATPNTVTGYSAGKLYTAADTIDHVTTNGLDNALIRYFALCVNVSGR